MRIPAQPNHIYQMKFPDAGQICLITYLFAFFTLTNLLNRLSLAILFCLSFEYLSLTFKSFVSHLSSSKDILMRVVAENLSPSETLVETVGLKV